MSRDALTPEIAAERVRHATRKARRRIERARMLQAHGHPDAAAQARRLADEAVCLARFYRARAGGATMTEAARHGVAAIWRS